MSVKLADLEFADEPDYAWIPDPTLVRDVMVASHEDALAMVRHILRERSDCRRIPEVLGASIRTSGFNEYGHNLFIHVRYTDRYHATYGGRLDDSGVSNVVCYMD